MPSYGMLCHVAIVMTDVSVNVSPILIPLITEAIGYSETSVLTRATRHNFPEDGILHSHCSENLYSYITLTGWAL
jgi:hypothetical protein